VVGGRVIVWARFFGEAGDASRSRGRYIGHQQIGCRTQDEG